MFFSKCFLSAFCALMVTLLLPASGFCSKAPIPSMSQILGERATYRQIFREAYVDRSHDEILKVIPKLKAELQDAQLNKVYVIQKEILLLSSWIGDMRTAERAHLSLSSKFEKYDQINEATEWIKSYRGIKKSAQSSDNFARYCQSYAHIAHLMGRQDEAKFISGVAMAEAKLTADKTLLLGIQTLRGRIYSSTIAKPLTLDAAMTKVELFIPGSVAKPPQIVKAPTTRTPPAKRVTPSSLAPEVIYKKNNLISKDGKMEGWQIGQIQRWRQKPSNAMVTITTEMSVKRRLSEIIKKANDFGGNQGRVIASYPRNMGQMVARYFIPPEMIFKPEQQQNLREDFRRLRPLIMTQWSNSNTDFCFVTRIKRLKDGGLVACFEQQADDAGMVHVGFGNGMVKVMSVDALSKLLIKQTGQPYSVWSSLRQPGAGLPDAPVKKTQPIENKKDPNEKKRPKERKKKRNKK